MSMPVAQSALADRVRTMISAEPIQREASMFGGWAFMVNEKLLVSTGKTGDLLVRVDAADHDRLLERPGARQAEMGRGRLMSPGWITVAADHLDDDDALAFWVSAALEHNSEVASGRTRTGPD